MTEHNPLPACLSHLAQRDAALRAEGFAGAPIQAWPDYEDADEDSDWTVGVPLTSLSGVPRKLKNGERPKVWEPIAEGISKENTQAIATLLQSAPALLSRLAAAEQERDRLRVVAEAASKMRNATEEYMRQTELDPPECSLEAEQVARKAEMLATIALDEALAALRAPTEPKEPT
jgi:hypothetical protein